MKEKVVIFGMGDLAQIGHLFLSEDPSYEVVAFTVDREYIKSNTFCGLPVIPFENIEEYYSTRDFKLFILIGYSKINKVREQKFLEAKRKGYNCITYIHPKATIASNVKIGENCFIFEDNTIQPFVTIEDNCIIWSRSHIGHHSIIRKNCFIAPCVAIAGHCEIGENTFIGINATFRDHIKIGKSNVIGAGTIIMQNTEDNQVFIANQTKPANKKSNELKNL